jgi:hypothetical protein
VSVHDTKALRSQILRLISENLGPRIFPACATEAMVNVLGDFMNCAVEQQDRGLLEATATALEHIASRCREMAPITGVVTSTGRPH